MNRSKLGQRLLIYGAITLIYALVFKDVTAHGNIVNLELLSQRQNLVIVGALMVLIGAILAATSNSTGKVEATKKAPEIAKPPGPNPVVKLHARTKERIHALAKPFNDWREDFFFRLRVALLCTLVFWWLFPSWQFIVLPLAVFLPLSMRKMPPRMAASKTCFWGIALTLPINIYLFLSAFTGDFGLLTLVAYALPPLVLIGFFIKYSRN